MLKGDGKLLKYTCYYRDTLLGKIDWFRYKLEETRCIPILYIFIYVPIIFICAIIMLIIKLEWLLLGIWSCDNCGKIFNYKDENWGTMRRDFCKECSTHSNYKEIANPDKCKIYREDCPDLLL